ncbi:unnamed protein product [Linum trigynum]|uniref:Reverse transcriptase zinc-binding domain-containing protein n=1 Tax=Linum trigynum TaxID=586398 RepID=A0AAV2EUB7_9ROSI
MKQATQWSVRNGETTRFWTHSWVENGLILEDFTLKELTEEELSASVSSSVDESGEWDWNRMRIYLPDEMISLIAGTDAPNSELGEDRTVWGIEKDGRFKLKSAYSLVAGEVDNSPIDVWRDLWKWKGPSRIKHFMWLASHNILLTNKERVKRKLTEDGMCKFCRSTEETTEHILRKCGKTAGLWRHFKDKLKVNDNDIDFQTWLIKNMMDQETGIDFGII